MSKNKNKGNSIKKEMTIKICLFGDYQSKNKELIHNYAKTGTLEKETQEVIEISRMLEKETIKFQFHLIEAVDDKMVSVVQDTNCVFILFDMSERLSFDNLLDKWLIWLRDSCKYQGKIFILGDYIKQENENQDFFLATSNDEVNEVIDCAELKKNTTFIRIGDFTTEEKNHQIDEKIRESKPMQNNNSKESDNAGGSMKNGGCIIY